MTLKELRATVKPLGYKIKTEHLSWGRHLTYVHEETGEKLVMTVLVPDQRLRWRPLTTLLSTIPENELLKDENDERVYGSMFNGKRKSS